MKYKVISNMKIGPSYYRMAVDIGAVLRIVKPGQFFSIRCSDGLNPLLRRPFSVHRVRGQKRESVEFLYKVIGEGTTFLSRKKKGDILDIIGPLGNGFDLKLSTIDYRLSIILVAGGMGVAPLFSLAEVIVQSTKYKVQSTRHFILIGAKTKGELLCEKDFKKLGFKVLVATEDGSKGKKCLATDLLKGLLLTTDNRQLITIYACGPNHMLKEIARIVKTRRIDAFGSFEEHMACGVGSCYGCVIKTRDGYKRVCKDGPIFNLEEITW